jgi:short subunit fatty acids transporter
MNNKYAVMIIWESGLSSSVSVEALNPAESKNKVLNQLSASVKSSILSIESKIDNQLLANKEV